MRLHRIASRLSHLTCPTRPARRQRHSFARSAAQRGMTLLEIMIVIAILGIVMGLVVVPRVMGMFGESKEKVAKLAVDKFAFEAAPQWQMATGKDCPDKLLTIAQHQGKSEQDTLDPWETPYKMFCGKGNVPAGVQGSFAVMSAGEDKKEGTEDDIKSWEPLRKK